MDILIKESVYDGAGGAQRESDLVDGLMSGNLQRNLNPRRPRFSQASPSSYMNSQSSKFLGRKSGRGPKEPWEIIFENDVGDSSKKLRGQLKEKQKKAKDEAKAPKEELKKPKEKQKEPKESDWMAEEEKKQNESSSFWEKMNDKRPINGNSRDSSLLSKNSRLSKPPINPISNQNGSPQKPRPKKQRRKLDKKQSKSLTLH